MSYLQHEPDTDFQFETSSEESDREERLEPFRLARIKDRPPIFEADLLHDALEDVSWGAPGFWTDTQVVSLGTTSGDNIPDINDDMARELAFYKSARQAAEQAICCFQDAGVPWQRPADYYAESVKSDAHMTKVKQQLMFEQQAIEQAEQRRKSREAKAFSKQVQAEKQRQRSKEKKEQISEITMLRKKRAGGGYVGDLKFDKDMKHSVAPDKAGQRIRAGATSRNTKRAVRDAKYGFGGRKKLVKQNDAESSADMSGLLKSKKRHSSKGSSGDRTKGKSGRVQKRPGKSARQNMANRRS